LQGAQVAVEVSTPDAARENVLGCLAAECPVVVGTTGWERHMGGTHDGERRDDALAAALARGGRVLIDANFSVGVHLFLAAARDVARRFAAHADFSPHIVETHHAAKRDAPSGTARALASHVEAGGLHGVGTTSVRVGAVPGTHELLLDGPFEQIVLRHEARDRRLFADGALTAARWLAAATAPGRYTMRDVLRSFAPDAS
jgi:4-hydroxy-tetrahydrodipicolinate reductase